MQREEAPAGTKRAGHGLRRSLAPRLPLQALRGFVFPSPDPFPLMCVRHLSPLSLTVFLPVPTTLGIWFLFPKSLFLHLCLYLWIAPSFLGLCPPSSRSQALSLGRLSSLSGSSSPHPSLGFCFSRGLCLPLSLGLGSSLPLGLLVPVLPWCLRPAPEF